MSRSHHTTRKHLKELEKADFSDKEKQAESVQCLKDKLKVKRRTKSLVRRHRHTRIVPPITPVEVIPIKVTCQNPYVHFPASPADLRAVMNLLPTGITDGLKGIELALGEKAQEKPTEKFYKDTEKDPYTGRLGYESLPKVYIPRILGQYSPRWTKIKIYGYVYPPDLQDRPMWEFYLRLQMLLTFVHELGHHVDFTSRVARGRWRADDHEKREVFADKTQYEWISTWVIPYLEQTYAKEFAQLHAWMKTNIGIEILTSLLAGDSRLWSREGWFEANASWFNTANSFEYFIHDLSKGEDITKTRLGFARDLHYADIYDLPLQIVELILTQNPNHIEALAFRGDLFVHQEKYDLAIQSALQALTLDPNHTDAWEVAADVYEATKQWHKLAETAEQLLHQYDDYDRRYALEYRAIARMEIGDFQKAQQDIDEFPTRIKSAQRQKNALQKRLQECIAESKGKISIHEN